MADSKKDKREYRGHLLGAALTAGIGLLLTLPWGDGLARLSYDLPFLFQSGGDSDLLLVYVNPETKRNLGQPDDLPLDRQYYAQLVERMTADGARLVLFDFTSFDEAHSDPAVDERFIRASRASGRVVLVTPLLQADQLNLEIDVVSPIAPVIADVVAGVGLCNVDDKPDHVVRRMFMGNAELPSAGWIAARVLDAPVARAETNRLQPRWLNYYGPPGSFSGVQLDQVLATNGLQAGFCKDKIVIVGVGSDVAPAGQAQDEFRNPYSRFPFFRSRGRLSYGAEIQAQTLLNLLHGDWLERLGQWQEITLIAAWGLFCGLGLSGRRPWTAALLAIGAVLVVATSALLLQLKQLVWWNWMIPTVQTSFAFVWSVGYQYLLADRRRRQLRKAFGAYLSPYMADRIANSEFDLSLGGKEVEATVMFTDLEGFTKMSESLPPAEVSKILTTYFNQTTRAILEQDGTIIKYIGDAVMAVWGAPLPDEKHAERAVLAAWGMHEAGKQEVHGRLLRTRIGVNTGRVLAGNLGSDFRFDYTLIGDTTNFASRLEGLNKYLGTDILISESTHAQLGSRIKVRPLGKFLVSGKKLAIGILDVLGPTERFPSDPLWLVKFAQALEQFQKRELEGAEQTFREVIVLRGADGPAEFYLREIAKARTQIGEPGGWDGTVRVDSK